MTGRGLPRRSPLYAIRTNLPGPGQTACRPFLSGAEILGPGPYRTVARSLPVDMIWSIEMAETLVAIPQESELKPLLGALERLGHPAHAESVGALTGHVVPSLDLMFAVAGHGKAQFALQTQYLVDRIEDINALMCVGSAGGLADGLTPGDVVIGTATIEHDYTERFVPTSLPCHEAGDPLLDAFRTAVQQSDFSFQVHVDRIASGDEDIVEPRRAEELREATGALCVAWEGSGGARVADFNDLDFLEVRSITDGADAHASTSFQENIEQAMANVGEVLVRWKSPE